MRAKNLLDGTRRRVLTIALFMAIALMGYGSCVTLTDSVTSACTGLSNGTVTIHATGGVAPYQYKLGVAGAWQADSLFSGLASGTYTFYVQDAGSCLDSISVSVTSSGSPFTLRIVANALSQTYCSGTSFVDSFWASGAGSAVLTYQWYRNGAPISGATSSSFTTSSLTNNDSIWVIGHSTSPCAVPDSAISNHVHITIIPSSPPAVTAVAWATTLCSGLPVVDTFWATGGTSALLTYQWYHNGTPVSGATSSIYPTSALSDNDSIWAVVHSSAPCAIPDSTMTNVIHISISYCPPDTVWPGDADADHIADNNDLLTIGLGYGATGPVRTVQGIVWQADTVQRWSQYFTIYAPAVNYDHADCNGDGIINADDTLAVVTNFGLTHPKTNGYGSPRAGVPNLYLQFSQDTVYDGDTLINDIILGDTALPITSIYGLSFIYHYDPLVFDTSSVSFGYINSWLGDQTNSINLRKTFIAPGLIKTAITGIDHMSRNGAGGIAKFRGTITTDNINGIFQGKYYDNIAYISDVVALDPYGNNVPINTAVDSDVVVCFPTGITDLSSENRIRIYPNPVTDQIRVISINDIQLISLYDVHGQIVMTQSGTSVKSQTMDVSAIADGVYVVSVTTRSGVKTFKLIISR